MVFVSQLAGMYALTLLSTTASPLQTTPLAATPLPTAPLWAGHQVTFGRRTIPFKGEVQTRMDSFVLARLHRTEDLIELDQTVCRVEFSKVAGVTVHMDAGSLPHSRIVFATQTDSSRLKGRSVVAWSSSDVDDDGNPGMTIHVNAPVCSGDLYVSNRSKTHASAWFDGQTLSGRAEVRVTQQILGAKGACLSVVAKDTDERQAGPFAYVPVPVSTTCETLLTEGWPVSAR